MDEDEDAWPLIEERRSFSASCDTKSDCVSTQVRYKLHLLQCSSPQARSNKHKCHIAMTVAPIVLSLLLAYATFSASVVAGDSSLSEEDLGDFHTRFRRNPRLCGTVLIRTLSDLCDSNYNSPSKRAGSSSTSSHHRHNNYQNEVFDMASPGLMNQWNGESDEYQMLPSEIDSVAEHQRSLVKQAHQHQQQQQSHSSSSFLPSSLSALFLGAKSPSESSNSPLSSSSSSSPSSSSSSHSNVLIRTVRSITDECCKSPCTLAQLKAYCGERKRSAPSSYSYTGSMLLPFMSGQSTSPGQFEEYAE